MLTTFHNVQLDIEAATPEKAYLLLCQLFETAVDNYLEYSTDSFTTQDAPQVDRDTRELWLKGPEEEEASGAVGSSDSHQRRASIMKEYTCKWTITVPAISPQAAVEKARTIQLDWKNTAIRFSVFVDDDGTDIGDFNSNLYPVKIMNSSTRFMRYGTRYQTSSKIQASKVILSIERQESEQ